MGQEPSEGEQEETVTGADEDAEIVTRLREVVDAFEPSGTLAGEWVIYLHPRDLGDYQRARHAATSRPPGDPLDQEVGDYRLAPDDWIPEGDPRILPEQYLDLPPGYLHLDTIPSEYAEQLVPPYVDALCDDVQGGGGLPNRRCAVEIPFEVLRVDTQLDHDTLDRENLEPGIDERSQVFDPGRECIHHVPIQMEIASVPGKPAGEMRPERIRRKLIVGIRSALGGSVTYPITRSVERRVEADATMDPVEDAEELLESDEATWETEEETVVIGSRTLELGRIILEPSLLPGYLGE